jgi:hypothetical protein
MAVADYLLVLVLMASVSVVVSGRGRSRRHLGETFRSSQWELRIEANIFGSVRRAWGCLRDWLDL